MMYRLNSVRVVRFVRSILPLCKPIRSWIGSVEADSSFCATLKALNGFNRVAVELPPVDSWGGALDGFDGRVGVDS